MLSWARREDARKGMGIEVRQRRGEMEESELEEGEACSSKEEDGAIDPDITFSYIGEKIRDVLGHFQKDFEGGVSFENLGRKIGDYGSFLPENLCITPTPSQSGNLQKSALLSTSRTPNSASSEQNLMFQKNTSVPLRKVPVSNGSLLNSRMNNEEHITLPDFKECTRQPGSGTAESKSTHQKTLKVRIKVGSDAVRRKSNSSIYSVMGLEYSPSSSLDSPFPFGGSSLESPSSICLIMTHCPVPAEDIVSPLHASFLQLMESYISDRRDSKTTVSKASLEACKVIIEDSFLSKDEKICSGRKMKRSKVKGLTNSETLQGEELVSSDVDAPKKSHSSRIMGEIGDETEGDGVLNDCDSITSKVRISSSSIANDEPLAGNYRISGDESPQLKGKPNFKTSLSNQVFEGTVSQDKESVSKWEKNVDGFNMKKNVNSKSDELAKGEELRGPKLHGRISEKTLKFRKSGSQLNITQPVEPSGDKKKNSQSKLDTSEYRNSSSMIKESNGVHIQECQNDAVDDTKSAVASIVDLSEIDHVRRNDQNPSSSEAFVNDVRNSSPVPNGLRSHESPAPAAVLVKEDWVCCDICQKWRLLPFGTNPDQLPKKWLCTMQVWLPGLNKCSVSEEETTRALHASYQAPLTENPSSKSLNIFSGDVAQNHSSLLPPNLMKKKLTLKSSDSAKKSRHVSPKSRSLNDVILIAPHCSQHLNLERDSDSKITEERVDQHLDNGFNGDGFLETKGKPYKSKGYRISDQDGNRASKKLKAERMSNHGTCEKLETTQNNNRVSFKMNSCGPLKDDGTSSCKDLNFQSKGSLLVATKKSSSSGVFSESVDIFGKEFLNEEFSAKKRKSKESRNFSIGNTQSGKEMYSGSDSRKEKKSRHLNKEKVDSVRVSEDAKCVLSETKGKTFDGRGEESNSGLSSRRVVNCVDPEKKDLSHGHTSTAAFSSSSKVSGSYKSKSNLQEARGSPVESVSSSPLRASNGINLGKERDKSYSMFWDPAHPMPDHQSQDGGRSSDDHNISSSYGQQRSTKGSSRLREKHRIPKSKPFLDRDEMHSGKDVRKRESQGRKEDKLSPQRLEDFKSHYSQSKHEGEATDVSMKVGKSFVDHKPQIPREPPVPGLLAASSTTEGEKLQSLKFEAEEGQKQVLNPTPNRLDGPSPLRRDSNPSTAFALLKEARDLKHTADRLKNEGRESESIGLYFEAALKFLHVASLRETSRTDGETTQSMEMYSSTAKLCEFCAHLYEKHKEMAAAALAYKCMEVALMKVVFSKDSGASKDRNELRAALLLVSAGESPSSSASDIDNMNNQNVGDKTMLGKAVTSPHGISNHAISVRNRPNFLRLLSFVQEVNDAMEASRKSLIAFNAINGMKSEEPHYGPEIIASLKQVLALSFHDVETLLRLVRLSMNSISC